jgi:modification methylase
LIENGLLLVGQTLFFGGQEDKTATILANGHIRFGDHEGSIHKVVRIIKNAPCNGWDHWYFVDEETGERQVIDVLRSQLRKIIENR